MSTPDPTRPNGADPRRVLLAEYDRLAALVMLMTDRVQHAHNGDRSIDPRRLRTHVARTSRVGARHADDALAKLGLAERDWPRTRGISESAEDR